MPLQSTFHQSLLSALLWISVHAIASNEVSVHSLSSVSTVGPSTCTRDPLTPVIIGGCPNTCHPLSEYSFEECDKFSSSGCTLKNCAPTGESPKPVRCSVDEESHSNITVCAGNSIVLDGITMTRKSDVSFNVGIRVPSASTSYKRTDVFIIADGNSELTTEATKEIAISLLDQYFESSNVHFGFGVMKNARGYWKGLQVKTKLTDDLLSVKKEIDNFEGSNSGEPSLQVLSAAAWVKRFGWRTDSNKIIVYLGGRPFQEPVLVKSKGLWDRYCLRRQDVIKYLKEAHITTIPVDLGDINGFPSSGVHDDVCGDDAGEGQATDIAKGTNGVVVHGTKEDVVKAVDSYVEKVPVFRTVDFDLSDCTEFIKGVKNTPAFPVHVNAGYDLTSSTALRFKRTVCTNPDLKCTIRYTVDGDDYTSVGLALKNVKCH